MNEHDPMCPAANDRFRPALHACTCEALRERDARVRADEQDTKFAQLDHAEAIAAKLVEVVCEQDDLIQIVGVDATNHRAAAADMRRERNAARAEVERLRSPEWEAEVRADERERIVAELEGPARESEAMYANAEAVAAKLVEVICDDEHWRSEARLEAVKRAYAQRDAARADAIRYSDEVDRMVRELSAIRMEHGAEVAALREQITRLQTQLLGRTAEVDVLREQLDIAVDERHYADMRAALRLRAKVEGLLPVESRVKRGEVTHLVDRAAVVALFDEAQPKQRTLRVELEDDDANIPE